MRNLHLQDEYLKKNPGWHIEDSPWKAEQIIRMMKRNNLQPKSICEIGCGAGEILNQLYLKLPENIIFTGYEVSPVAFDLCKYRTKDRLQFYLKDILEDNKAFFDMVLVIDVIEHVKNYPDFLDKVRRMGTYKLFHIPLELTTQAFLRKSPLVAERQQVGHIHFFTKDTAIKVLAENGYKILDYFYTCLPADMPATSFKSSLVKLLHKITYNINNDIAARILEGYSLMVLTS